jgi:hypothetical protein
MNRRDVTLMSLSLLAWTCANPRRAVSGSEARTAASSDSSPTIRITRRGSQPARHGPAENFTGAVRIELLFGAHAPSRVSGALVTFEPGARTA